MCLPGNNNFMLSWWWLRDSSLFHHKRNRVPISQREIIPPKCAAHFPSRKWLQKETFTPNLLKLRKIKSLSREWDRIGTRLYSTPLPARSRTSQIQLLAGAKIRNLPTTNFSRAVDPTSVCAHNPELTSIRPSLVALVSSTAVLSLQSLCLDLSMDCACASTITRKKGKDCPSWHQVLLYFALHDARLLCLLSGSPLENSSCCAASLVLTHKPQ